MAKESSSGLGVYSRYGPVVIPDGAIGQFPTSGAKRQLVVEFSAGNVADSLGHAQKVVLPPNIKMTDGWFEVESIVSTSGTTAAVTIGTQGALGTDGATVTGSALTVGVYTATFIGTWAGKLTGTTTVAFGITNGQYVAGEGRFFVEYLKL